MREEGQRTFLVCAQGWHVRGCHAGARVADRRFPDLLDFRMTNTMGRHSLDVYTAQIVLVYIWMALPGSIRYHGPWNVLVPLVSCVLLWALARFREPRRPLK